MLSSLAKGLFDAPRPVQTAPTPHIFTGLFSELVDHQGLDNTLIEDAPASGAGNVQRQARLGGLLNFYKRVIGPSRLAERGTKHASP